MTTRTVEIGDWDLSREREFIENLLCQRFDFFLVFYSLVVAAALTTSSLRNFILALTVGATVCSLLAISIARTQNKLELILRQIKEHDRVRSDGKIHPATWTDLHARAFAPLGLRWLLGESARKWVGYWIPLACAASLVSGAAFAWMGLLTPSS